MDGLQILVRFCVGMMVAAILLVLVLILALITQAPVITMAIIVILALIFIVGHYAIEKTEIIEDV